MSERLPIESAPKGAWVFGYSSQLPDHAVAIIADEEEGIWEDETGDWWIEARLNKGNGLTHWMKPPAGWTPEDLGTDRSSEPVAA